jgi:class 3 adenylate cyclase
MSRDIAPDIVMSYINRLFDMLERLCELRGVHKVETAGDCFIACSGVLMNHPNGGDLCVDESPDIVEAAVRMMRFAKDAQASVRLVTMPREHWPTQVRIGIHSGDCKSGLVGTNQPKFALFGDTMNTASRMESTCAPGMIQLSESAHTLLLRSPVGVADPFRVTDGVKVKGKGLMRTFVYEASPSDQAFHPSVPIDEPHRPSPIHTIIRLTSSIPKIRKESSDSDSSGRLPSPKPINVPFLTEKEPLPLSNASEDRAIAAKVSPFLDDGGWKGGPVRDGSVRDTLQDQELAGCFEPTG